MVNGAVDGVVTTLAVLAGVQGATLSPRIGLLLGLANLIGDGVSMGASNYLGMRSEIEQTGGSVVDEAPWRHGLATLAAFVVVGACPLAAYLVAPLSGGRVFPLAVAFSIVALTVAGIVRASFIKKRAARSAAEMLAVGMLSAGAAYLVGLLASAIAR
jgi:VIT1/CCC1 family predicted Fe2+/Mn2+ transporter